MEIDIPAPETDPKGVIEHLAAAICFAGFSDMASVPDDCTSYWAKLPERTKALYRKTARVWLPILQGQSGVVMPRQPTDEMIDEVVGKNATPRTRKRAIDNYTKILIRRPKLFDWEIT